jgi:hypothetical protein
MGTYPTSPRASFITWCDAHKDLFQANAASIGLSPAQATAFKTAVVDAQSAVTAQSIAKDNAVTTTTKLTEKIANLNASAAEMVRTIRAYAENTHNTNVYNLANIPPPVAPGEVPPPAMATDLTAALDASTGDITIKWKATQPEGASGTSYIVTRKALGQSSFAFLGVSGKKSFVDSTFTAGPDSVSYRVQGTRSDSTGPVSAILTVNFGRAPGGGLTITSETLGGQTVNVAA